MFAHLQSTAPLINIHVVESAVASFFTPSSQKPKDRTTWTERSPDNETAPTLLVAKYVPETKDGAKEQSIKRHKIAAFDLDSTLITPTSGKRHAGDAADWKWWHHSVPSRLRQLYNEEEYVFEMSPIAQYEAHICRYQVVVFTNQGGLTLHPDPKSKAPKSLKSRVADFKQKCNSILAHFDIPITLYAATAQDIYRKPRAGMWREMKEDYNLSEADIDHGGCIFVGDAGGRTAELKGSTAIAKDFSCSDRNLAHNIGIPFQTPEEYFLGETPRRFARDFDLVNFPFAEEAQDTFFVKKNKKDVILFVGPPGAGKSTFFWKYLDSLGYERINQDTLKRSVSLLALEAA